MSETAGRFTFRDDDDGHWYLVPMDELEEFQAGLDVSDLDECACFNEKYESYRISSHPSHYSFTDPIRI
jgi:hypothetical protein